MARRCELIGKGVQTGNNVSHAKNRTRRRFLPNLNEFIFYSENLKKHVRLRVSSAAVRSVDHCGGFDSFLLKAKNENLSEKALKIKKSLKVLEIAKTIK